MFTFALLVLGPGAALVSGDVALSGGRVAANAVVFLEGSEKAQPMAKVVIDQRRRKFTPHVSAVTVGTVIEFPNNDTVFHNVFAEFDAKKFDLGMYPRGTSRQVKFDKPGVVAILCSVHPEMSAYVMVVDTPYFAVADVNGRFQLKGVRLGEYTMRVWHESGEIESRRVTIGGPQQISLVTRRRSG